MDTILTNSENSKISKPHVLVLKFTDTLDLGIGEKSIALSNLSIYYKQNLKYQLQYGMINLNYQMDDILYQISKIILNAF